MTHFSPGEVPVLFECLRVRTNVHITVLGTTSTANPNIVASVSQLEGEGAL